MLEVRSGLLLGSMGDALAAITRVPSITKVHTITHVLTIANQPLDWSIVGGQSEDQPPPDAISGGDKEAAKVEHGDSEQDESEGGEGVWVTGEDVEVGGVKRETRCGFETMFVRLPDIPSSDLLHHFEPCCQFIRGALERRGTVLVHCEHGMSRSVTVVLAYLMWSEGRPFKILYDQLKEMKPEIRPNAGFVEQLKLWGSMRCRIDLGNKSYRAYRLQHMAKDMIDSGYVENLHSSLDPSTNVLESSAYFRCRKCRRLLFTEESVLQHELGRGQLAFKWHKRTKQQSSASTSTKSQEISSEKDGRQKEEEEEKPSSRVADDIVAQVSGKEKDNGVASSSVAAAHQEGADSGADADGGNTVDQLAERPPVPVTPAELAELRAHLASVVATANSSSPFSKCSSYFIEPVEWMEAILLGQVEGKILCPKCKGRLGSFNWAGEQCSCGQWVVPSFQIHRSKVDETRTLTRRKPVV